MKAMGDDKVTRMEKAKARMKIRWGKNGEESENCLDFYQDRLIIKKKYVNLQDEWQYVAKYTINNKKNQG